VSAGNRTIVPQHGQRRDANGAESDSGALNKTHLSFLSVKNYFLRTGYRDIGKLKPKIQE
jgi:hypothetical protein